MARERFSLLLLEPGEIYFEDFSVILLQHESSKHQYGRLKLCSKSIVFDPKDLCNPLLKIPLKDCTTIEELKQSLNLKLDGKSGITLECRQHVKMLEGNIVAPYTFDPTKKRFDFLFNYARVSDCLPQIGQLHRASTLSIAEQNTMLAAITFSRQSRKGFDPLCLGDIYEKRVFETQGSKITPLVVNPGHVLLTDKGLYFQPFNNIESESVLKIRLEYIKRISKRRFLLQQVGLEVYAHKESSVPHLFLALKSVKECEALYDGLLAQSCIHLEETRQEAITLKWQQGVLSNYDYILHLNSLADRTFNDLTQYPVFPWVVADYTSSTLDLDAFKTYRDLRKPIGALNEERLKKLKDRYDEMPDPKFLYGSHYSAPGFVLFYLVRKFPHYMLCLQNGRFDHPDRMFNSVPDVWRNVLGNSSDFKELVPEFYDVHGQGDFLVNTYGINFGHRHDGSKVGNVTLPPWASGPDDFVRKLRDALESDYVSQNLHSWIDLIFGYKQTGEEAIKANNVFYHVCYEGSVDLASVTDPARRHALEVQIMEFGQIPKQILTQPHPKRKTLQPTAGLSMRKGPDSAEESSGSGLTCKFEQTEAFSGHRNCCVRALDILQAGQAVASVGMDGILKVYSLTEHCLLHSVALATTPLSSVVALPGDSRIAAGSFDNTVIVYDLQFGRVLDQLVAHDDAVSCIGWSKKGAGGYGTLVTGSWDCSVKIWQKLAADQLEWTTIRPKSLVAELDHDSTVVCLAICNDEEYLVTGCEDGGLFLYCLYSFQRRYSRHTLTGHVGPVGAVAINKDSSQLVSCGAADRKFQVFDLATRMLVCCKELDQNLRCVAWLEQTLLLGGSEGVLQVWDLLHVKLLQEINAHEGAVTAVVMSSDGSVVVSGGQDGRVVVWRAVRE